MYPCIVLTCICIYIMNFVISLLLFTLICLNLLQMSFWSTLIGFQKSTLVSSSCIFICVLNCTMRLIFDLPELWYAFKLGLRPTPICDYCQHLIEMSSVYQMIDLVLRVIMKTETARQGTEEASG